VASQTQKKELGKKLRPKKRLNLRKGGTRLETSVAFKGKVPREWGAPAEEFFQSEGGVTVSDDSHTTRERGRFASRARGSTPWPLEVLASGKLRGNMKGPPWARIHGEEARLFDRKKTSDRRAYILTKKPR